jgi:hypothetical protein
MQIGSPHSLLASCVSRTVLSPVAVSWERVWVRRLGVELDGMEDVGVNSRVGLGMSVSNSRYDFQGVGGILEASGTFCVGFGELKELFRREDWY